MAHHAIIILLLPLCVVGYNNNITQRLCSVACQRGLREANKHGLRWNITVGDCNFCYDLPEHLSSSMGVRPGCLQAYDRWVTNFVQANDPSLYEAEFSSANVVASLSVSAMSFLKTYTGADTGDFLKIGNSVIKDYGNYDACGLVNGAQYCTTSFVRSPIKYGPFSSCAPSECTPEDVTILWELAANLTGLATMRSGTEASKALGGTILLLPSIAPFESECGNKNYDYTAGSYVMITLVCTFGGIVALATVWKLYRTQQERNQTVKFALINQSEAKEDEDGTTQPHQQEPEPPAKGMLLKIFEGFSLSATLNEVTRTRENAPTAALDGIRVFSMMWVVFGHTLLWPLQATGYKNSGVLIPFNDKAVMATWTGQVVQSAEFSVDTFFFMSGFLASYIALKKMRGSTPLKVVKSTPGMYLHRYLRISPLYFIIVWFYYEVVPLTASSPNFDLTEEREFCKSNAWKVVLYIQDFWPKDGERCYGVSWYLSDDMIFFWFTPFLLAIFFWNKILGYLAPICIAIASIGYSWWAAHHYKWRAGTFDGSEYMPDYYVPPWTRCPPYLIGIVFGYFYRDWKEKKWSLPSTGHLAWLADCVILGVSLIIMGGCVYGSHSDAQEIPGTMKDSEAYAYVALSKPAWSISLALLSFLCFEMRTPLLAKFLSLPFFQYVSKLTFAMYLLHPLVLSVYFFNKVDAVRYTNVNFTIDYLGILFFTTALAFVTHLIIELPLSTAEKVLLSRLIGGIKHARHEQHETKMANKDYDAADEAKILKEPL